MHFTRFPWPAVAVGLLILPSAAWAADTATGPTDSESSLLRAAREGPLAEVEELVFAVRKPVQRHYYENFGYYLFPPSAYPYPPPEESAPGAAQYSGGGRLCLLNLRTGQVRVLVDDPPGAVRDPQLHYEGQKILFSYRRGGSSYFHLYEIDIDGSNLVQLTDGPFDDIEPTYAPDGGILFCSTRCRRFVGCNPSPVALALSDIYQGRNMAGIERGQIERLLVLEQLSKPVQFSGGQEPLTIGGSFALTRILGTVPVEPDGSALMELPAVLTLSRRIPHETAPPALAPQEYCLNSPTLSLTDPFGLTTWLRSDPER